MSVKRAVPVLVIGRFVRLRRLPLYFMLILPDKFAEHVQFSLDPSDEVIRAVGLRGPDRFDCDLLNRLT